MEPLPTAARNNFFALFLAAGAFVAACLLLVFFLSLQGGAAPAPAVRHEPGGAARRGGGVAVLLFHAVDHGSGNPNAIRLEDLEATFQALRDYGYHPISLEQFHAFIDGRAAAPPRAVLLTFDDGYRDVYESVLPLTRKYRYPAVLFAVTKWFDPHHRPEPSRGHLSVEEARELLRSGLWSIGGHSYDGHRLVMGGGYVQGPYYVTRAWLGSENRLETEDEYRARVWGDIVLDRAALQRAGVARPLDFAYPYGAFNPAVVKMLNEAGYLYLYTNKPGLNRPGQDPSYICRISAGASPHETMALLAWYFSREP
ncbi:MAG: polysaccharide deacetylase family protein [Peptococcaceae bacterium]|nr:polysaccharide deacetylase family protein [Peptococcaceae bacterium]